MPQPLAFPAPCNPVLVLSDVDAREHVEKGEEGDPACDEGKERVFEDGVDDAFAGFVGGAVAGATGFADALADGTPVVVGGDGGCWGSLDGEREGGDVCD